MGLRAICCPEANTPADVSGSPGSAADGQEGGYRAGRGGAEEEDSFTPAGCIGLPVGLT